MNQYGTGQNVPYSGQQETDLVSNPRYTGQSGGTNPLGHDGRGPAEESRYGAAPLSTTGIAPLHGGAHDVWPSPAAPPHAYRSDRAGLDEYGNPRREGMVDKMKDAVGMGPHSGAPHGTTGYDNTPGYDNYGNPRREGMVDKLKDAAGVGPHSAGATGYGTTTGYDNYGNNPRREGMVDRMTDAAGAGPHTGGTHPHGTTGYDQSGFGTDRHHDGTGFGTGHHHDGVHVVSGNIPVAAMGERRVEPGYDASKGQFSHNHGNTLTGSPRKEGIVEKIKDAVGMGKHDNVHHGTTTPNTGTYGTGTEHGLLNHGNTSTTPGSYSHNHMVDTGLGHERHPGSSTGYPHETVGMGHTAGYPHEGVGMGHTDAYPHETMGERAKDALGVGPHHGTDYERTGKGYENRPGMMDDSKMGRGYDATRTGTDYDATRTGTGYDATRTGTGYDDTNASYPHNDATAYGVDGTPPKKGMMAKIKEKLHH